MNTKIMSEGSMSDEFFGRVWDESWTYIKTVVDVVREPVLILDKDFCVMAANEAFYRMFHVEVSETESKSIYALGNGQWDIPALRKLLEDILPLHTFFKGFEVSHQFPSIGNKVMMLNARRIYRQGAHSEAFPPIIMLAMEDVTDMMNVAQLLARHTNEFQAEMVEKNSALSDKIEGLEQEIRNLTK